MFDPDALTTVVSDLGDGGLSPADYLYELRDRYETTNPTIHAFVSDPEWEYLDGLASSLPDRHDDRPPLYGVPVGIKDIVHVDGMPTRAGSDVPPEALTDVEASVVTALREAGALVLGKTVTAEFAYFEPGPTRNPHDPDHTPGGSSSGSAAAVAAGLCPLALGTQTVGSVIRPAAFCGIVGFKPSHGRVPIDGVIPVAPSVDHVGWFTADVDGAALAASILCRDWDGVDRETANPDRPTLGVPDGAYLEQATEEGLAAFEASRSDLEDAGYEIRRVDPFDDIEEVTERHGTIVDGEAALSHEPWFDTYRDVYADETIALVERGREVKIGELIDAHAGQLALREQLHERMDDEGVDLWVCPSAPGPAPEGIDSTGNPVMNLPWSHTGTPALTVPAGRVDDLPVGVQCVGRFGADERVLAWGHEIEMTVR